MSIKKNVILKCKIPHFKIRKSLNINQMPATRFFLSPDAKVKDESGQNRAKAGKRVARKYLINKILHDFYSQI